MTGFDYFASAILLGSALVGFARGATRELVTAAALIFGLVGAILALRVSAPFAEHAIHTVWLARAGALLVVFVAVYIVVRLAGGKLTRSVRGTVLSGPDRLAGLALGLVRGAVAVAIVTLAIQAATPPERMPLWFTKSRIHPLADAAASSLKAAEPKGVALFHRVAPSVTAALDNDGGGAAENAANDPRPSAGYSEKDRRSLDVLVEKTR